MVKVVVLLKKKSRTTSKSFRRWWLEHHSLIVRRLPGLRRYVISFATSDGSPWDGMAELWFDNDEAVDAAYSSPIGKEVMIDSSNNTSSVERMRATEVNIL